MHRAKHRAGGRDGAVVPATTLIERFTATPGPGPAPAGVATLPAPGLPDPALPDPGGPQPGSPFGGNAAPSIARGDSPLFGAARHASAVGRGPVTPPVAPAPVPRVRPQVGAALSVTAVGVAAAVTAVVTPPVAPPTPVETTGSLAPVQNAAPAPAPAPLAAPAPVAPAPVVSPERPTVQGADLAGPASAEMERLTPAVEARVEKVVKSAPMSSPAAVRKAALSRALSKIGTPYRWGATGPNAFDCSGLVKWSFGNAGKALPRTSRALSTVGTPVSRANLQPGDLVFFYQPISHVGIYIGNGKIVHASQRGEPVKVSDMSRMRFTKAVRV